MSGKTTHWLLVLSVAFNIGLVGSWAGRALIEQWRNERNRTERVWCPLHRNLGVSEEQWAAMEPELLEFRRSSQALCGDIRRRQAELIDLIAEGDPDLDTLAARQKEILDRQQQLQMLIIEHLLAEKEVLGPEQQSALFSLMRRRCGCAGAGNDCGGCGIDAEIRRRAASTGAGEEANSEGL